MKHILFLNLKGINLRLITAILLIMPIILGNDVLESRIENDRHKLLYDEITSNDAKPKYEVFSLAMKGYEKIIRNDSLKNGNILTIIDMSLASTRRRFWTIDISEKRVLAYSLVAHGKNTGENFAKVFSNKNGSYQTSLGFYKTGETYYGKHGYSLYLDGLELGINDHARERAIVIHGAAYVSQEFIKANGRLGRSFGCPALPQEKSKEIIDLIKNESCLFIYFSKPSYLQKSEFLNN